MPGTSIQQSRWTPAGRAHHCRGFSLVHWTLVIAVLVGFCSLAADYGRVQLVKIDLERLADATAHDYMVLYNSGGTSYANSNGTLTSNTANNPVEGLQPTVNVQWGYWKASTKSFSTSNNGGYVAVKVNATCTSANGNAVPLLMGGLIGAAKINVKASAIAALVPDQTVTVNIPSTADPYFGGMPPSTLSGWGDDATDNAPIQVAGIPVTPGSILTFSNFTGTTSVVPGTMPYAGAEGVQNYAYGTAIHHGVSWDGTGSANDEFGIADAVMPESALMGLFLDNNRPDSTAAPDTVDWTASGVKDQPVYNSLQLKAPFYIGNGTTTSGVVQQFVVPPGATRLFIGIWDGAEYNNNGGSLSGTVTLKRRVNIVR